MKIRILIILFLTGLISRAQEVDEIIQMAIDHDFKNQSIEKRAESIEVASTYQSKLPDPMIGAGFFILSPETRVGPQVFSASVSQQIPWFGTLTTLDEWKTSMADLERSGKDIQANRVAHRIANLYFELYAARETIDLLAESRRTFKAMEKISTEKVKTGKSGLSDVLQIQMEIDEIDLKIEQLKTHENALSKILNIYAGRAESMKWNIVDTLKEPSLDQVVSVDSNNALITRLETKNSVLARKEEHMKKKGTPMINVGLNYVNVAERTDMMVPDNGKDIFAPMIGFSIPIHGKAYLAATKATQIEMESNALEIAEVEENLKVRWEELMNRYNQEQISIDFNRDLENKAASTEKILLKSYSVDGKDVEDLLRIERLKLKYEMNIVHSISVMWATKYAIRAEILSDWSTGN